MVDTDMSERVVASGSWYVPTRDNRNFGKKPMIENWRFVPLVRKNFGKLNHYSIDACQSCGKRHRNGRCQGKNGGCCGRGKQGHQVRNC